jgi:hypothetical protein
MVSAFILLLSSSRGWALEIHEIRWSFNDRPVAYQFNPVTLLVENNQATPFEGEIRFQPESYRGKVIGLRLATTIYIAPYEKRWVQFYPYFTESNANWTVVWDEADQEKKQSFLAPVPVREKTMVQLIRTGNLERLLPGVKQFSEENFPPLSGATDSLKSIILDHVPNWGKARRTAFLQWIYAGGTLHLFQNLNGDYPVFSESFSPLDQTSTLVHYGKGKMIRHAQKVSQLSSTDIKRLVQIRSRKGSDLESVGGIGDVPETFYYDPVMGYYSPAGIHSPVMSDEEILTHLTEMSKPQRIWYLNFFLSFVYLLVAGPGYYFVTRLSSRPARYYLCYFLGTAIFSIIFLVSGKYSSNQTSQVHSLFLAGVLPNQEIEISEWSSLGIVTGGAYEITHHGDEHLYASCNEFSKINGVTTSGPQGMMRVDIPPNSTQSFLHTGKTRETTFGVSVETALTNEAGLETLTLKVDDAFPHEVEQIYYRSGSKLYELQQEDDRLVFHGTSRDISSAISLHVPNNSNTLVRSRLTGKVKLRDKSVDTSLIPMFAMLLKRAVGEVADPLDGANQSFGDSGQLLVLAAAPEELFLQTPQVTKKNGLVLYSLEVLLKKQTD